jgi:putative ABC transport system permease protein
VDYAGLMRAALVALLRNKMRSVLTVLGITIGIAAVICVVAIGKAGQARVEQQLNNLGDNFVWIEAGGRAVKPASCWGFDPSASETVRGHVALLP